MRPPTLARRAQYADANASSGARVAASLDAAAAATGALGTIAGDLAPRAATFRTDRTRALGLPAAMALASLGGLAYGAGFPPFGWTAAPWVALAPLLVACARLSPARAALAGLCWTAAAAALVCRFLPGMLSGYFGLAPAWSMLAAVAAVAGLHGSVIAAWAAWVAWLARRGSAHPLLVACGWVACEFARAHGVLGSSWALSAASQVRAPLMIQSADVAGPYGIGFALAAVAACVAASLEPRLAGRRLRAATLATAALVAAMLAYGAVRLAQTFDSGAPVHVRVVQAGAPTRDPALRAARLARHVSLSHGGDATPDLIVWPENALDAYLDEPTPARAAVLDLARTTGADVVLGGPHWERTSHGTRYHNSAYLVRPAGGVVARYDKHRLVPFAEDGRGGTGAVHYSAGHGGHVLASRVRAGMLLCLEAMLPEVARDAVRDGAEVLVNLSNDAWFGRPEAAQLQLDIATLRAVESRRWLVRAAATGISAVIDPHGRTVARSGFGTTEALDATVRRSSATTPWQSRGALLAWLAIDAAAIASLAAATRSASPQDQKGTYES